MTTATESRHDQGQQSQQQSRQQDQSQGQQRDFSSSYLDDSLQQQLPSMGAGGGWEAQIAWQAYFDQAEQTLRTSRRVTEALFIGSLRQQIVQQVRQELRHDIRQQVRHELHQELQSSRS